MRTNQALHEQVLLLFIRKQPILKRFHIPHSNEIGKRCQQGTCHSFLGLEHKGILARFLVVYHTYG
jgi:hypothetical protein